jgi:hypothetical protein
MSRDKPGQSHERDARAAHCARHLTRTMYCRLTSGAGSSALRTHNRHDIVHGCMSPLSQEERKPAAPTEKQLEAQRRAKEKEAQRIAAAHEAEQQEGETAEQRRLRER